VKAAAQLEVPPILTAPAVAVRKRGPIADLLQFRQLILLLVVRELKVRYKRSVLGLLWTMLNPLLLMVVYTIVFTTIMPSGQPNFSVFLLSALLPWIFFATALMQGLNSVLANQELIRKVRVPQAVFPLSVVGSNLVNFALSLVPLFALMLAVHQRFSAALFTSGVTLLFATATVFFRDVKHLTDVLLQMLMYLSPVLYDVNQLGGKQSWWFNAFRDFLAVNPITYLIPLVRDPVYYARLPSLLVVGVASAWAAFALVIGFAVFVRLSPRHIHYL
jgi:lipopolysaccharide transport system permease protein